jgi:hypothetical protein
MAFAIMSLVRTVLLRWKIIENATEKDELNETIIAGTESEFDEVLMLLENAGMQERVLGRIETATDQKNETMGKLDEITGLLRKYPVKEIIFCQGSLTYKKIIEAIQFLPKRTHFKIYTSCTNTLIGSEKKNATGKFISKETTYRIGKPVHRRNKNLVDRLLALFFLVTIPVHFAIKSRPGSFLSNVLAVLTGRKTWIGYALEGNDLPALKPGILSSTGLPASLNTLSQKNLRAADIIYAKSFHYLIDLRLVWNNYKLLS